MILTGKRALITGGTKGIGAAIAIDLARQGCDVAINGRNDDASAAAVRTEIEATGRKCVLIVADVARPEEVDRLIREAEAGLDGLDILVHSAGGPSLGNIDNCSPEQWKATFDVHVHAAYFLCRGAFRRCARRAEVRSFSFRRWPEFVACRRTSPTARSRARCCNSRVAWHATKPIITSGSIASRLASYARGFTTR